jgi:hypothetical protein
LAHGFGDFSPQPNWPFYFGLVVIYYGRSIHQNKTIRFMDGNEREEEGTKVSRSPSRAYLH